MSGEERETRLQNYKLLLVKQLPACNYSMPCAFKRSPNLEEGVQLFVRVDSAKRYWERSPNVFFKLRNSVVSLSSETSTRAGARVVTYTCYLKQRSLLENDIMIYNKNRLNIRRKVLENNY